MASFGSAFAAARKAGKKTFRWNGKLYHTRTREEEAKGNSAPKPTSKPSAPKSKSEPKKSPSVQGKGELKAQAKPRSKPSSDKKGASVSTKPDDPQPQKKPASKPARGGRLASFKEWVKNSRGTPKDEKPKPRGKPKIMTAAQRRKKNRTGGR